MGMGRAARHGVWRGASEGSTLTPAVLGVGDGATVGDLQRVCTVEKVVGGLEGAFTTDENEDSSVLSGIRLGH